MKIRVTGIWQASLSVAIVVAGIFFARAQQSAEMKVDKSDAIEAGDTVTFTVKLDRAPNIEVGGVSLWIAPVDEYPNAPNSSGSGGATNVERTSYRVPVRIPITARTGTWHVTALAMGIPAAPNRTLKFNDVTFRVREKGNIVPPESGSIEISK